MTGKIPDWKASGNWIHICKSNKHSPWEFAQGLAFGKCEATLAYNIPKRQYGKAFTDGLNVLDLASSKRKRCGNSQESLTGVVHEILSGKFIQNHRLLLQSIFCNNSIMAAFSNLRQYFCKDI